MGQTHNIIDPNRLPGQGRRIIETIRRECLDPVIILGEKHLRRVLKKDLTYYHESRTHLGLDKNAGGEERSGHC